MFTETSSLSVDVHASEQVSGHIAEPAVPAVKRARRRTSESQAEFKHELLAFAKALYHERGCEALSIRALTEAFGMSTMSFYGYFDSKQDLVKHILTDIFEELLAELMPCAAAGRSSLQVVEAHVRAYIDYWERHPQHFRLVYLPQGSTLGDEPISFRDDAVYLQLVHLGAARVHACLGQVEMAPADLRTLYDLLFVKALGYLHATLVVGRFAGEERARLRGAVVRDIVDTVARAAV